MSAIKAFFSWLFLPAVGLTLLGVLAISLLIWFAGPAIHLEGAARVNAILAWLGLVLIFWLVRWLIVRRRGKSIEEELDLQEEDQREAELEAIREKMHEAIAALKSSRLGTTHGGSAALYALPWYMIIGPSAAGKSTLLQQSGLNFPHTSTDQLHVQGYGGTRNCDWWLSDEAILLDTAGRYTTEESDRKEWLEFLGLLRKHRKSMPINGVLVAISVSELLTTDTDGLERHVKILRARIEELMGNLGQVFPVFVVFTKCDLIHGFEAFFEDLNDSEREQLWGAYLLEDPVDPDDPGAAFERKMQQLYARLCELRLQKMVLQTNIERKSMVFDFPNQFQAASEKLLEFVNLLFRDNRYQETPRFAGVYFTSGTQEGTPVQRLVGNLREAFGYAENTPRNDEAAVSKPFFIKNLFREVILPLRGQARLNRKRLVRARLLKSSALAASLLAVFLTGALLITSWHANQFDLAEGSTVTAALAAVAQDDAATSYDRFRALARVYAHYEGLAWTRDTQRIRVALGIRTAPRQMSDFEALLEEQLNGLFLTPAMTALESALEEYARRWRSASEEVREGMRTDYYRALEVYLMTTTLAEHLDPEVAEPLLSDIWARELGVATPAQGYWHVANRLPHLDAMVIHHLQRSDGERWEANRPLVLTAQQQLRTLPDADILYAQLVGKGMSELPRLHVDDFLRGRNRGQLTSRRPIPALYTARGWTEFMQRETDAAIVRAIRGDWVVGVDGPAEDLEEILKQDMAQDLSIAIRDRYFRDYADAWFDFLGGVRPRSVNSLVDARGQFAALARTEGPLPELMRVIARNIDLAEPPRTGAVQVPKKLKLPGFLGKIFKKAMKKKKKTQASAAPVKGLPQLELWLGDVRLFTDAAEPDGISSLLEEYQLLLSPLVGDLERISMATDQSREALAYAARILGGEGSATALHQGWTGTSALFSAIEPRTREAFEQLFTSLLRETWSLVLSKSRHQLDRDWQSEVGDLYRARLRGRFPFDAEGPDARLSDVAEFFRPGDGRLWGFVETYMQPFLRHERRQWIERRWLGEGIGISPTFLSALRHAETVSSSLFPPGASAPSMDFDVWPVPVSGMSEMTLEVDGQAYRYRNEPPEWRRFSWPGGVESSFTRVIGRSTQSPLPAELRARGRWGLLHVLRDAQLRDEGNGIYLSEWQLEQGGRSMTVSFRIRASRDRNLFERPMEGFQLPSTPLSSVRVAEGR